MMRRTSESGSAGVRLLQYSDIENVYDTPGAVGHLAGALRSLRDESTLVVGTGDNTGPCALSLSTEAEQALEFFAAIRPDLETFGNHDFDFGLDRTRALVAASPQTWLTANIEVEGERFGREVGVKRTAVLDQQGVRIGFFGVTDPATPSINPSAAELTVTDPYEAARGAVRTLEKQDVDAIVALSHLGVGDDDLARQTDVDVILGGHDHTTRIERVDGTIIAHPGVNGTDVIEATFGDGIAVQRHPVSEAPRDETVTTAFRRLLTESGLDETVATVTEPIDRPTDGVYTGETRIGNWITDAYRWTTGADIGLQNSGGIRAGAPLGGPVTVADCMNVVPFDEPLVVATVTGSELASMFQDAVTCDSSGCRWHTHVSGARLIHDDATGAVEIVSIDGAPLVPDAAYSVATTKYLLTTDAELPVLTSDHLTREVGTQYEVLVEYARTCGIESSMENRLSTRNVG